MTSQVLYAPPRVEPSIAPAPPAGRAPYVAPAPPAGQAARAAGSPTASRAELARWVLEQDAVAMLARLGRVKPFALQETMLPAAAPMPATLIAIERYLMADRRRVRAQVLAFLRWLRTAGRDVAPEVQQRRFTYVRLRFNVALTQLDLFSEAITQRSEAETGVWLGGLDVAAQDALGVPGVALEAPPILCLLHRGMGGAIRRARTRLPGGGENPVSIIRIPRERMIGFGIASSLAHEVGHQGAALLELLPSLRQEVGRARAAATDVDGRLAWSFWERWMSEIVADLWAVGKTGITSTLGLITVVSLPRAFVFRISMEDPHPSPWIRVLLSCAIGEALYPHVQWRQLASAWEALYPLGRLDGERRRVLELLRRAVPELVGLLMGHRPASLSGRALGEVLSFPDRTPERLAALFREWRARPGLLAGAPPTLVFAVFGRARITGRLAPREEDRALAGAITQWALASTLDIAELCAVAPTSPVRLPTSLRNARRATAAVTTSNGS